MKHDLSAIHVRQIPPSLAKPNDREYLSLLRILSIFISLFFSLSLKKKEKNIAKTRAKRRAKYKATQRPRRRRRHRIVHRGRKSSPSSLLEI